MAAVLVAGWDWPTLGQCWDSREAGRTADEPGAQHDGDDNAVLVDTDLIHGIGTLGMEIHLLKEILFILTLLLVTIL